LKLINFIYALVFFYSIMT